MPDMRSSLLVQAAWLASSSTGPDLDQSFNCGLEMSASPAGLVSRQAGSPPCSRNRSRRGPRGWREGLRAAR